MWTTILSAIPWGTIFSMLLQLVGWVVEKQKDNEKLKIAFLNFISAIEKDIPVKVMDTYRDQIKELNKKIDEIKNP